MRIRQTFRIINWSAAAIVVAVLIIGKDRYYAWIAVAVLAAASLHFLIEAVALLRRRRFRRRLADTREFKEHQQFAVKDLDEALSSDSSVSGVSLPVILAGTVSSTQEKKAPLSGKKAIAWRLVAEPLEGLGKVGGEVLLVDSWWPDLTLKDETGSVPLRGPGVLDGSTFTERVCSMGSIRSDFPDLAPRIHDGLGIKEGKDEKSLRISLREIALAAKDKVLVYGSAQRTAEGLTVSGTDTLEDPASLMVRAASRPASSRLPRRLASTLALTALSVVLLVGTVALASSTVIPGLFAVGGPFDATRTAKVSLDLDGRQLRVSVADSHWNIDPGTTTKGYALSADSKDFAAARNAPLRVEEVRPVVVMLHNGDDGYPRWDGTGWLMETGRAAAATGSAAAGSTAAARSAPAEAHTGALYIRNLTSTAVTVRVMKPDNSLVADTSWSFGSYEAADRPRGLYLETGGKPLPVSSDARLEVTTKKGFLRILTVSAVSKWNAANGSWLFEISPEFLAGVGNLWVKNSGDLPIRIWIIGADGNPLFGDDPWSFEPKEGSTENKGLRLQYSDKNITITGRETIKLETQQLRTVYEGPLEGLARWKGGAWTVDVSRAVPKT